MAKLRLIHLGAVALLALPFFTFGKYQANFARTSAEKCPTQYTGLKYVIFK